MSAKNITVTMTPAQVDAYWAMSAQYDAEWECEEPDAEQRRVLRAQRALDQRVRVASR